MPLDAAVQRVAFDRLAASLLNEPLDVLDRKHFRGGGASIVVDQFVPHSAIKIVGTIRKRRLGSADAEHDPVGLDVVKVVEHEPRDGHRPQAHHRRGLADRRQTGVFRMESERNKCLKTAGFVLQLTQAEEMVGAVIRILNVSVEHGGIAPQTEFVGRAVDTKPLIRVGLVFADLIANFRMKDLRTATRQAAEPHRLQLFEDVGNRSLGQMAEPVDLDRRPRLEMQ